MVVNNNKIWPVCTAGALIAGFVLLFAFATDIGGVFITLSFIFAALALKQTKNFSNLAFTLLIFAAVSASLFYPQVFSHIGEFNLKQLIVPLLMLIMFGMGCSLSAKDFAAVINPRSV